MATDEEWTVPASTDERPPWLLIHDGRKDGHLPPCDALGERILLNRALHDPGIIDLIDLRPLLYFRKHQHLWEILAFVRSQFPDVVGFEFVQAVLRQLWTLELDVCLDYYETLYPIEEEYERQLEEVDRFPHHEPGRLLMSEYVHTAQWWLDWLRRCHTSRARIQVAQNLAESNWRSPIYQQTESALLKVLAPILPK